MSAARATRRRVVAALLLGAAALGGGLAFASSSSGDTAVLVGANGRHEVGVEIADTPRTRETGLMNRSSLPADHGMLFDFRETREVSMWMKNTLIPLDMVFVRPDGGIARVAANAQPLSLQTISSGEPVRFVLEIAGGEAARYGIRAGDRLEHPLVDGAPSR